MEQTNNTHNTHHHHHQRKTNNDFMTLHNAYIDEWLSISFLPILKTTYDGENNFYDISNLNIKTLNTRNIPFSEQLFALDRQFSNLINAWEKLSRNDQTRTTKIESYQSSFYNFIDRLKSTLEKTMIEQGGSLEDSSFLAAAISLKENNSKNKRLTIMARSRINTSPGSTVSYGNQNHLTGPISIVWNEILILISRKIAQENSKYQLSSIQSNLLDNDSFSGNDNSNGGNGGSNEINLFRQQINTSTLLNIIPLIFEWRIMTANSQKIISEEKRFKTNPFQNNTVFDHNSSSFISSPILISTTNKVASVPLSNIPNNNSPSSSSPPSPITLNNNNNNQENETNNNNNLSTSPQINSSVVVASPTSWTKAIKRPAGINNSNSNSSNNILNQHNNNKEQSHSQSQLQQQSQQSQSDNVNSENIPTGGIIKQGWMKKRGTKNKSWKKRYFILDMKKTLRYYKEKPTGNNNGSGGSNGSLSGNKSGDNIPYVNGNNISLPINNPHFSQAQTIAINNNNNNGNNNIDDSILSNYDCLKFKGSIDLHTSLVVAIKPSTCNININSNIINSNSSINTINNNSNNNNHKEDNNSYFGMDIITPKRTWNLYCDSSKSMEEWCIALKSANK